MAQGRSISAERLALWFFRLNGVLTIPNFVVHDETQQRQRTDVDILGVRFPYRTELYPTPLTDHISLTAAPLTPWLVIGEVKTRTCNLNGPWTDREGGNMQRVLSATGVFPTSSIEQISDALYTSGCGEHGDWYFTLFCLGSRKNDDLARRFPRVPQVTWDEVLTFVYDRFDTFWPYKTRHNQWDDEGRYLWDLVTACRGKGAQRFRDAIKIVDA
jgi:hypothetical protein